VIQRNFIFISLWKLKIKKKKNEIRYS